MHRAYRARTRRSDSPSGRAQRGPRVRVARGHLCGIRVGLKVTGTARLCCGAKGAVETGGDRDAPGRHRDAALRGDHSPVSRPRAGRAESSGTRAAQGRGSWARSCDWGQPLGRAAWARHRSAGTEVTDRVPRASLAAPPPAVASCSPSALRRRRPYRVGPTHSCFPSRAIFPKLLL